MKRLDKFGIFDDSERPVPAYDPAKKNEAKLRARIVRASDVLVEGALLGILRRRAAFCMVLEVGGGDIMTRASNFGSGMSETRDSVEYVVNKE